MVEELINHGTTISFEEYMQYNRNISKLTKNTDNSNEELCGKLIFDENNQVKSFMYLTKCNHNLKIAKINHDHECLFIGAKSHLFD